MLFSKYLYNINYSNKVILIQPMNLINPVLKITLILKLEYYINWRAWSLNMVDYQGP
jgi:hypothetical protein